MPTAAISLTTSAFADGPRVVEKSRGTAHPQGRVARRTASGAAQTSRRRHAAPGRRGAGIY